MGYTHKMIGVPKLKKKLRQFRRFQSDRRAGSIKSNWRKPKGIDCSARRRFKGNVLLPNVGYGSNKLTRYKINNGFVKHIVRNKRELEMLLMEHRTGKAVIAHGISMRKRKDIIELAAQLNIGIINSSSRKKL